MHDEYALLDLAHCAKAESMLRQYWEAIFSFEADEKKKKYIAERNGVMSDCAIECANYFAYEDKHPDHEKSTEEVLYPM